MARSGSENRQRQVTLKARFTAAEAALIQEQAARAGVTVAALIRHAVLGQPPLRASRRPQIERQEVARLIGTLGPLKAALKDAAENAAPGTCDAAIDAACRDIADLCSAALDALGRGP